MSREWMAALESIAWWLGSMVVVLGGCWAGDRLVARRRQTARIRIRVRHLDSPAARAARYQRAVEGLNAGFDDLRAAVLIPQQRTGGEHRAR